MKASDLFLKCLEAEGIQRIFGVPGEENADFMMSQEASNIEFVLCRHEQGAAFMAEAHGRLTGEVGVCLGTLGPGASNLITGVADANMDRAPMLVITGQAHSRRQHKESHQAMDVVSMFRPVTKWATAINNADTIPEIVRKAVKLATTEKPGACHIELAEDVAEAHTTTNPILPKKVRRPVPDDKVIDQAMDLIRSAKRPIILAGNGTIRRRASKQLRILAERTGIGVINTFMAKGAVDMAAPYCLFTIGLQSRDLPALALDDSDLVITLGYDMVEYEPYLWNPNNDHRILHMDFLPAEVDQYYHAEVEVVGDLAHTLWMLTERLAAAGKSGSPLFDLQRQAGLRKEMISEFEAHRDDATAGSIRPQKALWDVRQVLAPHDILLSDVGAHKMWIARYYQCHEPNTCLIPNGFCSMGFALPGAVGAALAFPERRIMAVCGDGGFLMNVQEMETAKRLNCNITVLIWQDDAYGLIAWKQKNQFGRHTDLTFGNPDFVKLAESFGWNGYHCSKSAELRDTLEKSFQAEGPSLVVIPIDYRENELLSKRLGEIACPI
jgi:acetolactate synthase I/II/III large subunit